MSSIASPLTATITSPPASTWLALEADRLVARLQAGVVGGAAGDDLGDERAGLDVEVEALGELRVERLGGDAGVGVANLAVLAQLLDRALGEVDRDGEADALVAAGGGLDLLVDADDLAGARRAAGRRSCRG